MIFGPEAAPARLIKEYGMPEVAGIVCAQLWGLGGGGCRTSPLPGCRIIAVDPETGAACPPEGQGELIIQSNTVMNGYYGVPEADAEVLRPGPDGDLMGMDQGIWAIKPPTAELWSRGEKSA